MIFINNSLQMKTTVSHWEGFYVIYFLSVNLDCWGDPAHTRAFLAWPYNFSYFTFTLRAVEFDLIFLCLRKPFWRIDKKGAAFNILSMFIGLKYFSSTIFASIVFLSVLHVILLLCQSWSNSKYILVIKGKVKVRLWMKIIIFWQISWLFWGEFWLNSFNLDNYFLNWKGKNMKYPINLTQQSHSHHTHHMYF